jgi:hypothetical protein
VVIGQIEENDPECRADPDGVRLAIRASTLDDWAQASGEDAVVKIKDFFREGFSQPRSHIWGVEVGCHSYNSNYRSEFA